MSKKVSVLIITYNQEKYIEQALKSALEQQINFDYEIIIGEDHSSDRTKDIVLNYQVKYPDIIKVITSEVNLGISGNFYRVYQACVGQYIHILEGDDFWICDDKLQRQVNFLNSHSECVMCAHNTKLVYENSGIPETTLLPPGQRQIFYFDDILNRYMIHTSSVLFRKQAFDAFSDWFFNIQAGDYQLYTVLATYGTIGYLDEVMSAYRIHSQGEWSRKSYLERIPQTVGHYKALYDFLNPKYRPRILLALSDFFKKAADLYLKEEYSTAISEEDLKKQAIEFMNSLLINTDFSGKEKMRMQNQYMSGHHGFISFQNFKDSNIKSARRNLTQAVRFDKSWLINKGFWSVMVEDMVGKRITNILRRLF